MFFIGSLIEKNMVTYNLNTRRKNHFEWKGKTTWEPMISDPATAMFKGQDWAWTFTKGVTTSLFHQSFNGSNCLELLHFWVQPGRVSAILAAGDGSDSPRAIGWGRQVSSTRVGWTSPGRLWSPEGIVCCLTMKTPWHSIHRWLVGSPHRWLVMRKAFPKGFSHY